MDHGDADHFTNQIKFWGIQPSYRVAEPQSCGSHISVLMPL